MSRSAEFALMPRIPSAAENGELLALHVLRIVSTQFSKVREASVENSSYPQP